MTRPLPTSAAPIEIGHVVLTVQDLPGLTTFYRRLLGLEPLAEAGGEVTLGAGGRALLVLRADPAARRASPAEAGLFHTAFLMPDRAALARWLIHAAGLRAPLQGASDHGVSEAIYLADPEGNGIEVYADRPRERWHDAAGRLRMGTERLDLDALARAADAPWTGAPEGLVVGHVHLQVGDVGQAAAFWSGVIGMPAMAAYPGATFHGAGGYHHHIAGNVWNSRGAGARALPATGLSELVLRAEPAALAAASARAGGTHVTDPWGTPVTLLPKAA
jgi:catechol 2,3-dioxygenase